VDEMIARHRAGLGVQARAVGDEEIVHRLVYALVNEGARILEEGIAASAADIDVIWCNGYGFPRHRGGPMFYADTLGLDAVVASIRELAKVHGKRYWTPAPLLVTLADEGRSLEVWQAARDGGGGDAA
jgi:3-hydroxyacyl-CoA dehydrogenase